MNTRPALLLGLAGTLALSLACDVQRGSNSPTAPSAVDPAPASPRTTAAVNTQLTGYWVSSAGSTTSSSTAAVADMTSCSNFQLRITSQSGNTANGTFSVVCLGTYPISGTATGVLTSSTSARIELTATASVPGSSSCPVSVVSNATVDGDFIRLPFTAQTCMGTFAGNESLRKSDLFPEPAPLPPPPPAPEPPPTPAPPAPADELDLSRVRVMLGPSHIGSWPQTSTVINAYSGNGQLCVNHTHLGRWPAIPFFDTGALIESNQWVFANINGQWVGGAADWVRPNQECKAVDAQSIGRDAFYSDNMEPLRSWVPKPGEVFGVMVSTPARAYPNMLSTNERSNVVLIRWQD